MSQRAINSNLDRRAHYAANIEIYRARKKTAPSADPAYRRAQYAAQREAEGKPYKRWYKARARAEPEDYMPLAKALVAKDPFRDWIRGPELWLRKPTNIRKRATVQHA